MRYWIGFVLAGFVALPLGAAAQTEESEEAPKQAVQQEPAPSAELAPEELVLKLELATTLPAYSTVKAEPSVRKVRLAQSGRFLLGVGVPTLIAGALVAGTTYAACSYTDVTSSRRVGWIVFGVGAGVSISGLVTILAATRKGRRATRGARAPRGYRIAFATTTTLAVLAGLGVGLGGTFLNVMCNS